MCELPARRWTAALRPGRVALGVLALTAMVVGMTRATRFGPELISGGGVAFLVAVLLPFIREIEFGIPSGIRIVADARDRRADLEAAFRAQAPEIGLIAGLLCVDRALATELVEAAWARSAGEWRGPATPALRTYVLCSFIHLLLAELQFGRVPHAARRLDQLEPLLRIALVLSEFAQLSDLDIAALLQKPPDEVRYALYAAHTQLAAHR